MIDAAIFISFNSDCKKRVFNQTISFIKQHFTHIYIIAPSKQIKPIIENICKTKLFTCTSKKSNTTDNDDSNTVYLIDKIQPNIHIYSIRVHIETDMCFYEREREYNIHVDYVYLKYGCKFIDSLQQLVVVRNKFISNIKPFDPEKSVIVFDLDDTIISKEGDLIFKHVAKIMNSLREVFDLIVLWSHGSPSHVNSAVMLALSDVKFDEIMTLDHNSKLDSEDYSRNKGKGKLFRVLNQNHGVGKLPLTVLVDDQFGNFIGDYDMFVHVPNATDNSIRGPHIVAMLEKIKNTIYNNNLSKSSIKSLKGIITPEGNCGV